MAMKKSYLPVAAALWIGRTASHAGHAGHASGQSSSADTVVVAGVALGTALTAAGLYLSLKKYYGSEQGSS